MAAAFSRRGAIGLATVSLVMVVVAAQAPAQPVPFAPGQVWSITSTEPTPVTVVIGRIEPYGAGTVVHVSILDVPIPPGAPGAGGTTRVAHMPFDEAVLAASVDKIVGTVAVPLPTFEEGLREWRGNRGGVWTLTVSEALDVIFQGMT